MREQLKSGILLIAFCLPLITTIASNASFQDPTPQPNQSQPAATPQSQEEVIRVETDLVNTLFTAVDRDRQFFKNLRKEDLRIFEDGIEQEIASFERETDRPLTLVLLVDTSRSQERTLPEEKRAAKLFIEAVARRDKDRIAVVSFTGVPKVELTPSNDLAAITAAIDRMAVRLPAEGCDPFVSLQEDPRCWTSIWDSVLATTNALAKMQRKDSRQAIILLTDGDDTSSQSDRDEAIKVCIANDVTVYSIGIGDPELYAIKKSGISKLSEQTGGRAFFPRADAELASAFAQIQDELRSQYVVAYTPKNRARDGSYRKVKLEVTNPELRKRKLQLLHRQGYYARKD